MSHSPKPKMMFHNHRKFIITNTIPSDRDVPRLYKWGSRSGLDAQVFLLDRLSKSVSHPVLRCDFCYDDLYHNLSTIFPSRQSNKYFRCSNLLTHSSRAVSLVQEHSKSDQLTLSINKAKRVLRKLKNSPYVADRVRFTQYCIGQSFHDFQEYVLLDGRVTDPMNLSITIFKQLLLLLDIEKVFFPSADVQIPKDYQQALAIVYNRFHSERISVFAELSLPPDVPPSFSKDFSLWDQFQSGQLSYDTFEAILKNNGMTPFDFYLMYPQMILSSSEVFRRSMLASGKIEPCAYQVAPVVDPSQPLSFHDRITLSQSEIDDSVSWVDEEVAHPSINCNLPQAIEKEYSFTWTDGSPS